MVLLSLNFLVIKDLVVIITQQLNLNTIINHKKIDVLTSDKNQTTKPLYRSRFLVALIRRIIDSNIR